MTVSTPPHRPSPPTRITYPVHSNLRGKGCERSEQVGDKWKVFYSLHSMAQNSKIASQDYNLTLRNQWLLDSKSPIWSLLDIEITHDMSRFLLAKSLMYLYSELVESSGPDRGCFCWCNKTKEKQNCPLRVREQIRNSWAVVRFLSWEFEQRSWFWKRVFQWFVLRLFLGDQPRIKSPRHEVHKVSPRLFMEYTTHACFV